MVAPIVRQRIGVMEYCRFSPTEIALQKDLFRSRTVQESRVCQWFWSSTRLTPVTQNIRWERDYGYVFDYTNSTLFSSRRDVNF